MISASQRLIAPAIKSHALAKRLGARSPDGVSRSVSRKITALEPKLEQLLNPHLYYQSMEIDLVANGEIRLQGGQSFKSGSLSKALKDCHTLICFIATIGGGIDREITRLVGENRSSAAYVLDCMGSVAAENVVEGFHHRMRARCASLDQGVSYRFSPGYCDWPITEQKNLFGLFDSERIGVTLLDSCLMWPRKSISGVFGIYTDAQKSPYNPCQDCPKKNCNTRRL
jgi:hypothetical protein